MNNNLSNDKIAYFQQSARCPVVKQPNLATLTPGSWVEFLRSYYVFHSQK